MAAVDEGLFTEFKQKWKGAIEDLVKPCAGQRQVDLTLDVKTLASALRENAASWPIVRRKAATKVLSTEVVKAGEVVQALGEKLKAGAALALADGGCEVFAGTLAALAKFGAGPIRDTIRGAIGRQVMRAARATMDRCSTS
jgi:hypothetical protein